MEQIVPLHCTTPTLNCVKSDGHQHVEYKYIYIYIYVVQQCLNVKKRGEYQLFSLTIKILQMRKSII